MRKPSRHRAILRPVTPTLCPAAVVIAGADRRTTAVLCRIDSTACGQADGSSGPIALVRAAGSPAAYHGYCHSDLQAIVPLEHELGALASPEEVDIADRARNSGRTLSYRDCPSWRAEQANRQAARLAEQPGERRVHRAPT